MAKKLTTDNGTVTDANVCDNCGAPVHPSLECKKCHSEQ